MHYTLYMFIYISMDVGVAESYYKVLGKAMNLITHTLCNLKWMNDDVAEGAW